MNSPLKDPLALFSAYQSMGFPMRKNPLLGPSSAKVVAHAMPSLSSALQFVGRVPCVADARGARRTCRRIEAAIGPILKIREKKADLPQRGVPICNNPLDSSRQWRIIHGVIVWPFGAAGTDLGKIDPWGIRTSPIHQTT